MFWKFSLSALECRAYTLLIKNLEVGAETCCQQNALKDEDEKISAKHLMLFFSCWRMMHLQGDS